MAAQHASKLLALEPVNFRARASTRSGSSGEKASILHRNIGRRSQRQPRGNRRRGGPFPNDRLRRRGPARQPREELRDTGARIAFSRLQGGRRANEKRLASPKAARNRRTRQATSVPSGPLYV